MASISNGSWETDLRDSVRTNFGQGWLVNGETSGKTKILYVYNEGLGKANKRTSVTLPIKWKKSSGIDVLNAIKFIKPLVVKENLPLSDAGRRWKSKFIGDDITAPNKAWQDFLIVPPKHFYPQKEYDKVFKEYEAKLKATKVDQFLATKRPLSSGTEKKYFTRIQIFLEVMNKRPAPNTGTELIKLCAAKLGENITPDQKKRYLDTWCDILTYGIKRHSMNDKRWQPPEDDYRKELKGVSKKSKKSSLTPYVKESDLLRLLDDLESSDPEMFLATGLISIFGLRLSELAELEVRGGKLYVGHIKNNLNTTNQDRDSRRVFAMDLTDKPNLGNKLISLLDSELVKLPATVLKQISLVQDKNSYAEVGKAFTKKLKKHPIWKEIEKTNSDITPYSLRHRFAHQCHTGSRYPISIKDAAEAMGHTVDVHNGSYASYTDEMSVERAFDLHNKERITL